MAKFAKLITFVAKCKQPFDFVVTLQIDDNILITLSAAQFSGVRRPLRPSMKPWGPQMYTCFPERSPNNQHNL